MACSGTVVISGAVVATAKQQLRARPDLLFEDDVLSDIQNPFHSDRLKIEKTRTVGWRTCACGTWFFGCALCSEDCGLLKLGCKCSTSNQQMNTWLLEIEDKDRMLGRADESLFLVMPYRAVNLSYLHCLKA